MTIAVSPGVAADLPSIMPVMNAAFSPVHGEAWSLIQCTGALALPGSALLIATISDDAQVLPCGFAILRTVLDETELLLIAVDPDCQRLGVGTKLIDVMLDMLAQAGVSTLHVEVRHDNPALRFYQQHGFTKIGERHNYYRRKDGQVGHALTLARQITRLHNQKLV